MSRRDIERGSLQWMQEFLLLQGRDYLRCDSSWSRKLMEIATSFHEPEIVKGLETVGWDKEQMAFRLPGCNIGLNGVRKVPMYEDEEKMPAANLKYSSEPLPTNWAEMGTEYELNLFWASLAMILNNIPRRPCCGKLGESAWWVKAPPRWD